MVLDSRIDCGVVPPAVWGENYANLSFECWAYLRSASLNTRYIAHMSDFNQYYEDPRGNVYGKFNLGYNSTNFVVNFNTKNGGGPYPTSSVLVTLSSAVVLNQWTHIAISYYANVTGGANMYINGELVTTTTGQNIRPNESSLKLHLGNCRPEEGWAGMDGILDEVRLWNGPRSQSQIKSSMYKRMAPRFFSGFENIDNLLAYWRLDEGVGTSTVDLITNRSIDRAIKSFNGTLIGNALPTYAAGSPIQWGL